MRIDRRNKYSVYDIIPEERNYNLVPGSDMESTGEQCILYMREEHTVHGDLHTVWRTFIYGTLISDIQ